MGGLWSAFNDILIAPKNNRSQIKVRLLLSIDELTEQLITSSKVFFEQRRRYNLPVVREYGFAFDDFRKLIIDKRPDIKRELERKSTFASLLESHFPNIIRSVAIEQRKHYISANIVDKSQFDLLEIGLVLPSALKGGRGTFVIDLRSHWDVTEFEEFEGFIFRVLKALEQSEEKYLTKQALKILQLSDR